MTGEDVLSVASREIGYREGKGKHNKFGEWYGLNGVAWCMEFVQWCYHQAGVDLPLKTPSCGGLLNWYKRNQPECVTREPVRGCIVIFDFPGTAYNTDHTGLFVSKTATHITTIDGNTSNASEGNGGWVQQRTRKLSYANPVYIVPRALKQGEEDEDVKRYQTIKEIKTECPWAVDTIEKLMKKSLLNGDGQGLDLTRDMLRMFVINDRAGVYGK